MTVHVMVNKTDKVPMTGQLQRMSQEARQKIRSKQYLIVGYWRTLEEYFNSASSIIEGFLKGGKDLKLVILSVLDKIRWSRA